jgi:predicted CoA-substrate-specific enzyme activase
LSFNTDCLYIGLDVGSVSIKLSLVGHKKNIDILKNIQQQCADLIENEPIFHKWQNTPLVIINSKYRRIMGEPVRATLDLLRPIIKNIAQQHNISLSVTGAGGKLIAQKLNISYQNEFRAIARGVSTLHPEIQTILEMGGDSSKYIILDNNADGSGILDYEVNGDCAAGTGSFIDQQASRLLYQVEDIGDIVLRAGKPASIAGRCSVFAKSDMIHAQQKGFQPPEILKGLCQAVVRNFKGTIIKGKTIVPPIAFIGGVAANKGIVQALREILSLDEDSLIVPRQFNWMEAIGAALLSFEQSDCKPTATFIQIFDNFSSNTKQFDRMEPLKTEKLHLLHDLAKPNQISILTKKIPVFLGIDIGSVTTKLAVIDEGGDLIKGIYTKTQARPIEVVKNGLLEIKNELGDQIEIKGVGTTGSGRELIGELINADTIKDEITAHKTGAMHISRTHTNKAVDTIFDIGGQDSKFISLEDGVVIDFTMNEACAAGTGSFLEEQAEKLGINIKEEFASLAFQSENPIRLGERCTVFMEKEIIPYLQQDAEKKDIVAGLAYSIVINYLNRVVRGRKLGNVIYFQGGTAYNDAVAAAFVTVLNKEIIVPPFNGIIGAIGAALLAQEKIKRTREKTTFRGFHLETVNYKLRSFTCKACTNFCDIQEFNVEGKKTYWGDKCAERYRKEIKLEREPVILDLIKLRESLLHENFEPKKNNKITIGIPRSLYFYDQFPFWYTYFNELGFNVMLSDETNRQIIVKGVESRVAEPCFPVSVAQGHFQDLIEKGADFIFVPNVVDAETQFTETNSFYCPWGQTLCFVLKSTPKFIPFKDKILSPNIRYRQGKEVVKNQFHPLAKQLGISHKKSDQAIEGAYLAWKNFQVRLKQAGEEAVATLLKKNEKAIILLGRPYNMYDKIVNLNIPDKLRRYYGINVIPMDFLNIDSIDILDINDNMYWNYGRKIIQAARWSSQYPNFHLIYITNFKCGPDSYIKHYVREAAQKPYLTIQFDEHGNDAGIITRCEAYLDSKGFLR